MTLPQGKKSHVSIETIDGVQYVRKVYNDNGPAEIKHLREVAFYAWYAGVPLIPEMCQTDDSEDLVVTLIDGERLEQWLEHASEDEVEALSLAHGHNIGMFLIHEPLGPLADIARSSFFELATAKAQAAHTLDVVGRHLRSDPRFDLPELHAEVDRAGQVMDADGFWGEEILCKLDWNPGNAIVRENAIVGYVDFEQAFFGNRAMFMGTVIDHNHHLDWPQVRRGIAETCGSLPSIAAQHAAASFSMCQKILGCCGNGKIQFFTPERLLEKFAYIEDLVNG